MTIYYKPILRHETAILSKEYSGYRGTYYMLKIIEGGPTIADALSQHDLLRVAEKYGVTVINQA